MNMKLSLAATIAFLAVVKDDCGPLPRFSVRRERCEPDALYCGLDVASHLCLTSPAGVFVTGGLSVQLLLLLCRFMDNGVALL